MIFFFFLRKRLHVARFIHSECELRNMSETTGPKRGEKKEKTGVVYKVQLSPLNCQQDRSIDQKFPNWASRCLILWVARRGSAWAFIKIAPFLDSHTTHQQAIIALKPLLVGCAPFRPFQISKTGVCYLPSLMAGYPPLISPEGI